MDRTKRFWMVTQIRDKYGEQFKKIFKREVNQFLGKLSVFNLPDFDIVKFDEYMCSQGYQIEKDGSLKDYVLKHFEKEGCELIENLIAMTPNKI